MIHLENCFSFVLNQKSIHIEWNLKIDMAYVSDLPRRAHIIRMKVSNALYVYFQVKNSVIGLSLNGFGISRR